MQSIEAKIKVNKTLAAFDWVKSLSFVTPNGTYSPEMRSDETNAIIYLTCMYLSTERGINPMQLQPMELLTHVYTYVPILTVYLCHYFLLKNNVELTDHIISTINQRVIAENLSDKYWAHILAKMSGQNDIFIVSSSIQNLSFNLDVAPEFVSKIVGDFLPIESNLVTIESIEPGMNVCGVYLTERLAKSEHSEIWKGTGKYKRIYCVKIEDLDIENKDLKALLKGKNNEKIVEYLQQHDEEFLNFNGKLRSYPNKVETFEIDYYGPLNKKVKRMTFYEGPINKVQISNKNEFLMIITNALYNLHLAGIVFGNVGLGYIMVDPNPQSKIKYRFVDYNNVKYIGEESTLDHGVYRSLTLLAPRGNSNRLTPYNDIESLLYTFNDLILKNKSHYVDLNDEIQKKSSLSTFSGIIAGAIQSLRLLMSCDPDPFFLNEENKQEHVRQIYTTGFVNMNTGENVPGIVSIIKNLTSLFKEAPEAEINLTYANQLILSNIRNAFTQDPRFQSIASNINAFNEITIKILNVMTTSVTYDPEDMRIITAFLS